jgi:hypothetical protein
VVHKKKGFGKKMEKENKLDVMTDKATEIAKKIISHAPFLYFHEGEDCFPIRYEPFFKECKPLINDEEKKETKVSNLKEIPSNAQLYKLYKEKEKLNITFSKDESVWKRKLQGSVHDSYGYCRAVYDCKKNEIQLIYYYLFSHTEPYACWPCCCGCGCCCSPSNGSFCCKTKSNCCNLNPQEDCCIQFHSYAHHADVKFITVYLDANTLEVNGVYFGAHGSSAGRYHIKDNVEWMDSTHPVAYSARGDHSFYATQGWLPRIFCFVWEELGADLLCKPKIEQVFGDDDKKNFDPKKHGWNYLPGYLGGDSVGSPATQWFWKSEFDKIDNSANGCTRVCCCKNF